MNSIDIVNEAMKCEAFEQFQKAYELYLEAVLYDENPEGIYGLGRMYYWHEYVNRDLAKAYQYIMLAEKKGVDIDGEYCISIGNAYELGRFSLPKDSDKAFQWYKKAADKGEEYGYECMGDMYFNAGEYKKAFKCFSKPEKKQYLALFKLGYMYENGIYVMRSKKKAIEYYETLTKTHQFYNDSDDHYRQAVERLQNLKYS